MAEKVRLKKTKGKSEGISKKPYRPKPPTEKQKMRMREEFKRQQKPYRYSDKDMTDEEKRRMIYLTKEGHRDPGHMERMMEFERSLREAGLDGADNSKMKDGGMARGKGGKMYQHNYATGGSVVDHLKKGK
jgi:hypothetical protein